MFTLPKPINEFTLEELEAAIDARWAFLDSCREQDGHIDRDTLSQTYAEIQLFQNALLEVK